MSCGLDESAAAHDPAAEGREQLHRLELQLLFFLSSLLVSFSLIFRLCMVLMFF